MRNEKQFQGWRSEQIVKVFLLNSGLFDVAENYSPSDRGIDFIAIHKEKNRKFNIDVKATKYSRSEILRKYSNHIDDFRSPMIQFYVDYDKETGYFRLTTNHYKSNLNKMIRNEFISEIKNYAQHWL
ncbi:hypothetical protein [Ulvibacterium sp.]|uniref:hypothetical protein n=1 Tax=Ulvibacterium sp. TaxID=2665914 RepID=UPI003BACEB18